MPLPPERVVASFDSASVMHASIAAALRGRPFSNLGNPEWLGRVVRVAGRMPWPALRELYRRVGGAEGVRPHHLDQVDLGAVAEAFAAEFPPRNYPAVMIGSSNGALAHLAAVMQIPWLPQTLLVPVHRLGDPDRPDQALEFGRQWGPALLRANPEIVLHQMHDSAQDRLMTARMTYFRVKWRSLHRAYLQFLTDRLAPGAPVFLINDQLRWPSTRVDERHWFQTGGLGGLSPREHLSRPHAPPPDGEAAEAEWGAEPEFVEAVRRWCDDHDHPLVEIGYTGPQQPAHPVADILRDWLAERGERTDTLIVPSFILSDPWRIANRALVPFWTYFAVQDALAALDRHLQTADSYRRVLVLAFQHGVSSPGIATADDFAAVIRKHGAEPTMLAVDPDRWPHDIGSLARYGAALDAIPPARRPWSPLAVDRVIKGLTEAPWPA
ncbi:hypothetical protein FOE78_17645 [Microlunatus elymi]|uniref:Uncharacterized protein n=1 Tax=Microlunatus elymi TaxID=2596828 RepID=A0A516Q241_9ACTN|nr:hypothetical protein [Microlunatus elymi]QDP97494.1 hypothetical protein FOE78_17645 [Microlunatus elymi]